MKTIQFTFKLILISILLITVTCKKDELPQVTKLEIGGESNVAETTATVGAEFIDVSNSVTTFGFCYATSSNPSVSGSKTTNSGTAKKGEYSGNLTALSPSTKYYIRAYAMDGGKAVYSSTEISFTTLNAKYINITAPVATDNWTKGTTKNITWKDNITENVHIELFKDGTLLEDIIASTESDETHNWPIRDDLTSGTDYSVKISSIDDASIFAQSEDFEISETPNISITAPINTSNWQKGSIQTIKWNDNIAENVNIELFKAGVYDSDVATDTPSDEFENWTVPTSLTAGFDYSIKITSIDDENISDESVQFQISDGSYISISSPTIGDHLLVDEIYTIKWTDNISENVNIELYKGVDIEEDIVTNTQSDGSYNWTPTDLEVDTDYSIKITSVDNSSITDESEQFSIAALFDYDGNGYNIVTIGSQTWMKENLKVTRYPNGDAIPLVTDNTAWANLENNDIDDAYCYYNNNSGGEANTYGALYTYAAAIGDNWARDNAANQGVCPTGWHLPSDAEWKELEMYLGMSQAEADNTGYRGTNEGGKLKATGDLTTGDGLWTAPNTGATNESGFTGIPGGYRYLDGSFDELNDLGRHWSSTEANSTRSYYRTLYYNLAQINRYQNHNSNGYSVKCIKD